MAQRYSKRQVYRFACEEGSIDRSGTVCVDHRRETVGGFNAAVDPLDWPLGCVFVETGPCTALLEVRALCPLRWYLMHYQLWMVVGCIHADGWDDELDVLPTMFPNNISFVLKRKNNMSWVPFSLSAVCSIFLLQGLMFSLILSAHEQFILVEL